MQVESLIFEILKIIFVMNKKMNYFFKVTVVFSLVVSTTILGLGQNLTQKREIFQNQQRALSLSFYKNSIKSLEDAPMRCFARKQIVEFIFSKKVKDQFDTAESFAIDCLEDIKNNPKQFTNSLDSYFSGEIIHLLKANLPGIEKKIGKYQTKSEYSNYEDFLEADANKDANGLISKLLGKLQKGEMPPDVFFTIAKIRQTNPEASIVLLEPILRYYENSVISKDSDEKLFFISKDFLSDSVPIELKRRYVLLAIRLGQKAIFNEDVNSRLFTSSFSFFKWTQPIFKQLFPDLYPQALTIYTTLESKYSQANTEELEIYKRIEESDNKLEQTIIEAEATDDKEMKRGLWTNAAKLALKEKKFRLAVDCITKRESDSDFDRGYKTQILTTDILPAALEEKDFEAAEYVVKNVEDSIGKGFALLEISFAYSKTDDKTTALEKLNEALRVLDKAENDIHKVRTMLSAARLATKIENANAFEIADSAIKVINRLPTPNTEDKLETKSRTKHFEEILHPTANNIANTFKVLAEKDVDFAFPIAQAIQRKDLRLIAEIVVEMNKKYAYTPKPEINSK